jgi:hypothetical protein
MANARQATLQYSDRAGRDSGMGRERPSRVGRVTVPLTDHPRRGCLPGQHRLEPDLWR